VVLVDGQRYSPRLETTEARRVALAAWHGHRAARKPQGFKLSRFIRSSVIRATLLFLIAQCSVCILMPPPRTRSRGEHGVPLLGLGAESSDSDKRRCAYGRLRPSPVAAAAAIICADRRSSRAGEAAAARGMKKRVQRRAVTCSSSGRARARQACASLTQV